MSCREGFFYWQREAEVMNRHVPRIAGKKFKYPPVFLQFLEPLQFVSWHARCDCMMMCTLDDIVGVDLNEAQMVDDFVGCFTTFSELRSSG